MIRAGRVSVNGQVVSEMGANGPVDDRVAKPYAFLGAMAMGQATSHLHPATALPYFQLNIKLPAAGSWPSGCGHRTASMFLIQ
jgi:hypothetical protein